MSGRLTHDRAEPRSTLLWVALALASAGCDSSPHAGPTSASTGLLSPTELATLEPQVSRQIEALQAEVASEPRNAERNGRLGMLLHAYRWLEPARRRYEIAASLEPRDFRWPYLTARIVLETGDSAVASGLANKAISLRGDFVPALLLDGQIALKSGRFTEAKASFERAIAVDAKSAHALCGLGEALRLLGDLDSATRKLEEAIALEPRLGQAIYQLSLVTRARGDAERAGELLRRYETSSKSLEPPDPLLAEVESLRRDSDQIFRASSDLFRIGKFEEAIRGFETALERNPSLAMAHYDIGLALQQLGRHAEAVPHYEAFLVSQPRSPDALNNRGLCAQALGQKEEAGAWFEKAIAADSLYAKARINLATLWLGTPRNDDAVRHVLETLRTEPGNDRALELLLGQSGPARDSSRHRKLGTFLKRQRLHAAAAQALRRGLREAPEDWKTSISLAWLLATCANDSLRDPAEALRLAEPLVQAGTASDGTALDTLAAVYASLGRFDDAVATVDRALALPPGEKAPQAMSQRRALYLAKKPYREE